MSNVAKLKKKAAEYELKRQFDKALAIYIELLDNFDAHPLEVDVALFNRVGDMLLRQGNVADAVDYYERAVDKYAEGGFFNNAIALCNKILRQSPGRTSVYYKLGKISAQKGFKADAKANFLEYADRMQKSGRIDEAFRALKEFADLCPDQDDIRLMLADQLSRQSRAGEAIEQLQTLFDRYSTDGRDAEARATLDRIRAIDPAYEPRVTGQQVAQKSSELIFLDVYAPDPPRATPGPSRAVEPPVPRIGDLDEPGREVAPPPADTQLGGFEPNAFDAPAGSGAGQLLDLEPTSFDTGAQDAVPPAGGMLEGLEATSFESPADAPARAADVGDIGDLQFLESAGPAAEVVASAPSFDAPPEIVPTFEPGLDVVTSGTEAPAPDLDPSFLDFEIPSAGSLGFEAPFAGSIQPGTEASVPEVRATDPGGLDEIPLMDLELPASPPTGGLRPTGDLPLISGLDGPAEQEQAFADAWAAGSSDQAPAFAGGDLDLPGFGGVAEATPGEGLEIIAPAEDAPDRTRSSTIAAEQSVARLETESLAHPDDLLLRRQLGEARLEAGDRDGGVADLEFVMAGLEREEDLAGASSLANEIARLMPDSVRIQQKRVEYAFRTNDRRNLVAAYLDLAAALLGDGQHEKARTVYKRVLDLAPDDIAAQAGLAALTPADEPAPAAPPAPRASAAMPAVRAEPQPPAAAAQGAPASSPAARPPQPAPAPPAAAPKRGLTLPTPAQGMPGVAASRDKVWTVPAKQAEEDAGSLVNLGDWFRDDEAPKSTRMVVEEKEPTGDEEADFAEMLRKFKQGVAENVDAEDHQAHYDLGVAFKEMGLVDEAIAEFQKALRAPSNRLPTYEALGQCFVDKGQFQVATAILSRALGEHPAPDEQLIGLLYLLGVAAEALGRQQEAIDFYQRVFVIDIQFRDVADRLAALEQVGP